MRARIAILLITGSLAGPSVLAANAAPTLSELSIRGTYASVLNEPPFQLMQETARRHIPLTPAPKTPTSTRTRKSTARH
jgi:hypothetical protein